MKKSGFSLLELLIVIIIIGVLATLFLPNFRPSRESALDDEARANLKLIQAAEKIYKLEYNVYFPVDNLGRGTTTTSIVDINQYLKLAIPAVTPVKWNYSIAAASSNNNINAQAIRYFSPADANYQRTWAINITAEEPACNGRFAGRDCVNN